MNKVPSVFPLHAEFKQLQARLATVLNAYDSAFNDGYEEGVKHLKAEGRAGFVVGLLTGIALTLAQRSSK